MSSLPTPNFVLADALRRKEDYRKAAKQLSWEEKVASIKRMQEASIEARRCMREALSRSTIGSR